MSLSASTTPSSTTATPRCPSIHDCGSRDWSGFVRRQRPAIRRRLRTALQRCEQFPTPEWLDDLEQEVYCRLLDHDRRRPETSANEFEHWRFVQVLAETTVADDLRRRFAAKRDWRSTFSLGALEADLLADQLVCRRPNPEQGALHRDGFRKTVARVHRLAKGPNATESVRALVLSAVAGWTSREIATRSGEPLAPSSVETRLCRLKTRLRAELAR